MREREGGRKGMYEGRTGSFVSWIDETHRSTCAFILFYFIFSAVSCNSSSTVKFVSENMKHMKT